MTTGLQIMIANPTPPDLMVKRLFTVAEILSRKQTSADASEFLAENRAEKHDEDEIEYLETKD